MFIVQGSSGDNESYANLMVETAEEALEVARRWLDRGKTSVRIVGDGRIYLSVEEFSATIDGKQPAGCRLD